MVMRMMRTRLCVVMMIVIAGIDVSSAADECTVAKMKHGTADTTGENPLKGIFCKSSCICKALTMGFVNYQAAANPARPLKHILQLANPVDAGPFPLPNAIDSVCMALYNSASQELSTAMGNKDLKITTTSDPPAFLGDKGECLSTCLRISAYMQRRLHNFQCDSLRDLPANQPDDPINMLGDIEMPDVFPVQAGNALQPDHARAALAFLPTASFLEEDSTVRKLRRPRSSSQPFPEFWRKLGLTPESIREEAKSALYYTHYSD